MLFSKNFKIGTARHGAILIENLHTHGRWFQPGPATRCPPGYFSARQVEQLNAHPDLSIAPEVAP